MRAHRRVVQARILPDLPAKKQIADAVAIPALRPSAVARLNKRNPGRAISRGFVIQTHTAAL